MNEVAESEGIFMDISTEDRIPSNTKGINKYIKHIYSLLNDAKVYVR